ncbi:hypothetical protein OG871_22065 [Kitasatospora sp. NBC_00374]|uniref:hypothetical protein n=1 Tax=Kitasatospora sp. NBC_00374 TaxID=2975964 RepID=UPI0030E3C015
MTAFRAVDEFDRQVQRLIALDYPALTGLPPDGFRALLAPLRADAAPWAPPRPSPPRDGCPSSWWSGASWRRRP